MTDPALTLAGLSLAEKRMLATQLLLEKEQHDQALFPLSHGQRGMWFLYQLNPTNAAYHVCYPSRIRSRLDLDAFRRAVQALVDRHPALRTTFEEHHGELLQRIQEKMPVALEVHDAASWDEAALRARVAKEALRPFDLERGPLLRLHLFTRAPDDHVFLLTTHHIVGDFWSMVLIMEEMCVRYPAERDGVPLALPPLRQTYRDFVRWQAQMLAGPEGKRLRAYWERQLAGVPAVLELPTDRPRPPRFTHRGAAVTFRLGAGLTQRLKALAQGEQVTLYAALLAAFQALLGRYTGQEDFVIGSPFAGRSRPEFEEVIGYLINMLPLRADLSGNPTFRTLLHRVSRTAVEALQNQDYPYPLLVERLNRKRDPSRSVLVQASFTLEKSHRADQVGTSHFLFGGGDTTVNVGGLDTEPYPLEQQACQEDLEMVLEDVRGTIEGLLRYNTDLFDAGTVERMVRHFQTLLGEVVADPDSRLSELSLLTEAERRQVVHEWNQTRVEYPRDLCLHHPFEQQAARRPAAEAVRFRGQSLTYAELDAWANGIADGLRRLGVGPGTLVALCLERSPEMIAAMLGTLKAGAAFVPLDPASPAERQRLILADIAPPVLLTQQHLVDRLPAGEAERIVVSREPATEVGAANPAAPVSPPIAMGGLGARLAGPTPGDLAYIIYTSGSTGLPKGVMVEHGSICNTVLWHQQALTMHPDDRVVLTIPYFFDAALSIIFPVLAAGACLILAEPEEDRDPALLRERIARDRVTILPASPRLLWLLLDGATPARAQLCREACRTVRWVCTGGEAMPPDLPGRVFDLLGVDFYNLYGPTEVAIDATCWPCRRDETRPSVPIGRPIANVQVYVLDGHRQPVPVGVPGELYIGGAGVARGYLNDPQLTKERFLPDPFSSVPGARLYRTGDRCRWLAEGALEFMGRLDDQVKVRGFRVEVGEVEAALAASPLVRESAVAIRTDDGEPRLVAYVVARTPEDPPTADQLRRHLQTRLPDYMVPSTFVLLPALPRTPTDKLDRKALPAPSRERQLAGQPFVAPRTPLEEFLAGLWRDLLRLEKVGVEDNFFELGGNSIQAAMLINRVQEKLGHHVYTVALFDAPTITGLVRYLGESCPDTIRRLFGPESLAGGSTHQPEAREGEAPAEPGGLPRGSAGASPSRASGLCVPLQPQGTLPPCFLVHPPGGIVVCYQLLAQHLGRERPCYGIRARGLHGEQELPGSLEEMAAEYVAAIRALQPKGPYHLGGWSLGGVAAYEMAHQLLAQGQQVGLLALLDTTIPDNEANRAYAEDGEHSGQEYGLNVTLEELDRLGPEEQLPYLWQHVQRLGLVEPDMPMTLVQQILDDLKRLFHVHVRLATAYAVQPYPGRITLFRPAETPVPVPAAPARRADRGWGKLAAGVDVHVVPGHHHSMVKEPHVQELARQFQVCLEQAEKPQGVA